MAETIHIEHFANLERGLLNEESQRLADLMIDKIPVINDKIVVNDFFREPDAHTSLFLIALEQGAIEVRREDDKPISIEFFEEYAPRSLIAVLKSPLDAITFSPFDFNSNYIVKERDQILCMAGLTRFIDLVSSRSYKKQKMAGVVVHLLNIDTDNLVQTA